MKNKTDFIFVIIICSLILIGSVFVIAFGNKNNKIGNLIENNELIECEYDEDCADGNPCTLHYCRNGLCITRNVILCYQNDGCCPPGCTPENDNDC